MLITLIDYLEKLEEPKYRKNTIMKLKNEVRTTNLYDEESLNKLRDLLSRYIPLELLTAGWGQEEEKREKKKEKSKEIYEKERTIWKRLDECHNPKEIRYLIYKKQE